MIFAKSNILGIFNKLSDKTNKLGNLRFFQSVSKIIKRLAFLIILLASFIFSSAYSFASCSFNDLKNSVFRLHVIANSDSNEDQSLKLKVRDSILSYINQFSFSSRDDTIEYCKNHLQDLKNISLATIHNEGYSYDVNVEVGDFYFPTKTYGDISFPSGFYDALKVEIGRAQGHNWWCVMFPPLCFVDVSSGIVPDESKKILEDNLSSEDYNLVLSGSFSDSASDFNYVENTCSNYTSNFNYAEDACNSNTSDDSNPSTEEHEPNSTSDSTSSSTLKFKFKIIELINSLSSKSNSGKDN